MLPINKPHAALSLLPQTLYRQTFHVEGRAHLFRLGECPERMTRHLYSRTRTRAIYSSQQTATKAESATDLSRSDWHCLISLVD
jgi:hypothetical protein